MSFSLGLIFCTLQSCKKVLPEDYPTSLCPILPALWMITFCHSFPPLFVLLISSKNKKKQKTLWCCYLTLSPVGVLFWTSSYQMVPCRRPSWSGYVGTKYGASSQPRSNRCERRPRPGVVHNADVLSGDRVLRVLGQSVFRSRRAILGQVIQCVGWAFRSCQSHLLYFMLSLMSLFPRFLILLCVALAFCSFVPGPDTAYDIYHNHSIYLAKFWI